MSKIGAALRNPELAALEVYRVYQRQVQNRGISIPDADWDTLVILDACRYDIFEQRCSIDGTLSKVISKGSHTSEFLAENFGDESFPEMVYVSATPQLRAHELEGNFHAVVPVWEDGWDESLSTVPPAAMAEATQRAHEEYPDKRIISHFLQPHYPFIGDKGREIDHGTVTGDGVREQKGDVASVWDLLEAGELSTERVREAYVENLELVLPEVEAMTGTIDGKVVVTSDHGNVFGRWGIYGHPPGMYLAGLVEVPWLELPFDHRRDVVAERTTTAEPSSDVTKQLQDLGYK